MFLAEVTAGIGSLARGNRSNALGASCPEARIAVLIPAHDESVGLVPTLADVRQQLDSRDRLLVVADNCSDDTAAVAATHGAEVIERHDLVRRGKGYALDFGLQHLNSAPPDILIMIDADCRLSDGAIHALVQTCVATHRPTQALYLMTPSPEAQINQRVAEFAWRVKNWLRPAGLDALHLPCQLMGTGMAFPWEVIRSIDLASGSIVEDLKLGLDLTAIGHPPKLCLSALVTSQFAPTAEASRTQRERWESGHITTILATAPHLLREALAHRDIHLLALTFDLMIPPLSLLALAASATFVATSIWAAFDNSPLPFFLSSAGFLTFVVAAVLSWVKCGSDILPVTMFPSVLTYILKKTDLYRAILLGKASQSWKRTERKNSGRTTQ